MIKLKQVLTVYGETTLTFECDGFPDGVRTVRIPLTDIIERLKTVKQILGRNVTLEDARDVIVTIINQLRQERTPITERFDFTPYIGVDIEQ
jgi:hypothetical protein